MVTADDVENHKPAPDTFLKAAALIGVPAEECCAYEDTDLGMEAIRAAGMGAVDVREFLVLPTPSLLKHFHLHGFLGHFPFHPHVPEEHST